MSALQQTDWLDWRRQGIGASDVAAILGISPWASPWSVWADKSGLVSSQEQNEVMEAGHWLELAIGPWFESRTGLFVGSQQEQVVSEDWPVARATLDGVVYEDEKHTNPIGLLEIKTAGAGKEWDEVPVHYLTQGQWQMFVTGMERVYFAVLMGRRLDIHLLERDQDDIDYMVERVTDFWINNVQRGKQPPVDGHEATITALNSVYPNSEKDTVAEIDSLADQLSVWRAAKEDVKSAKAAENYCKAKITAALREKQFGSVDGRNVVSWKTQQTSAVDIEAMREDHPDLVKKYTKKTDLRVLRDLAKKEKS